MLIIEFYTHFEQLLSDTQWYTANIQESDGQKYKWCPIMWWYNKTISAKWKGKHIRQIDNISREKKQKVIVAPSNINEQSAKREHKFGLKKDKKKKESCEVKEGEKGSFKLNEEKKKNRKCKRKYE